MDNDARDQKIQTLTAAVERLSAEVETLRAVTDAARERIELTMRGQTRCPACGCTSILHSFKILDRADGIPRRSLALVQPSVWSGRTEGELELYACTRCGLAEWYVKQVGDIDVTNKQFEVIEGVKADSSGPYR
jgi:predicted nucleic-acid-binding Zn-ribbon protein